jgi:hypothetical protein
MMCITSTQNLNVKYIIYSRLRFYKAYYSLYLDPLEMYVPCSLRHTLIILFLRTYHEARGMATMLMLVDAVERTSIT